MKIVGKIIAVLYSILFVLILFGMSLLIASTNLLKGDFYADLLKNVNLKEIDASSLGLSDEEGVTLEDALADKLSDIGLSKSTSKAILENAEIKEVVGDVIGQVINYKVGNGNAPKVTKEQVKTVFENEEVKKAFGGESIDSEDLDEMVNEINSMLKELVDSGGLE